MKTPQSQPSMIEDFDPLDGGWWISSGLKRALDIGQIWKGMTVLPRDTFRPSEATNSGSPEGRPEEQEYIDDESDFGFDPPSSTWSAWFVWARTLCYQWLSLCHSDSAQHSSKSMMMPFSPWHLRYKVQIFITYSELWVFDASHPGFSHLLRSLD